MFGWVLRFILLLIVLRAIGRLVRGIMQGLNAPADASPAAVGLVRDPVCGTFVVPSRSLTAGSGPDTRFFCSERCRQAWSQR
jgi:YHS domain-containing protein